MTLRLKGERPKIGETDRRYYMIDVQVGKRRERLSTGTRNRALAERKEQQVVDALRNDTAITKDELVAMVRGDARAAQTLVARRGAWSFEDACKECLRNDKKWLGRKGWASLSDDTYVSNVASLKRYIDPSRAVASIDQECMDQTVKAMRRKSPKARTLSDTTINRLMYALVSILSFAKYKGEYRGDLPTHERTEEDNARQFILTREQEAEMLALVAEWDFLPDGKNCRPKKRDAADFHDLFAFLTDVGCRLSAGLRVKWTDIAETPHGRVVRFWGRSGQKRSLERSTPLTARALEILERRSRVAGKKSGPFAGMTKGRAEQHWVKAKARSSFAHDPDAVIHSLRHTCATRLLELTGDIKLVQDWLGHADLATTSKVYAKVMLGTKARGVEALNAAARAANQVTGEVTEGASFRDRESPETGTSFQSTH